jgi:hypothetical protein
VMAAEDNCRWCTRQQMVVSKYVDDDDDFLDSVKAASWIKSVPLNGDVPTVTAVPGQLRPTSMMAFSHEDGASIKTMKSVAESTVDSETTGGFETAEEGVTEDDDATSVSSSGTEESDDSMDKLINCTTQKSRQTTTKQAVQDVVDLIDDVDQLDIDQQQVPRPTPAQAIPPAGQKDPTAAEDAEEHARGFAGDV